MKPKPKIFLLWRDDNVQPGQVAKMVLVARKRTEARNLASQNAGTEGADVWRKLAKCEEVGISKKKQSRILLKVTALPEVSSEALRRGFEVAAETELQYARNEDVCMGLGG